MLGTYVGDSILDSREKCKVSEAEIAHLHFLVLLQKLVLKEV